jgi:predicted ribosomally synthesized peptide with nif11-like leader
MSEDAIAALRAAAQDDETIRTQLAGATSPEDVVRIAGEAGCDLMVEDLLPAGASPGELSLAELDAVSGGWPFNGMLFTVAVNCM